MSLSSYAAGHRPRIASDLAALTALSRDHASPWASDVENRFASMAGGKALRGVLTLIGFSAASRTAPSDEAYRLAAAIELLHAMFLVHDDIMDRDELRRGHPSVYAQYMSLASKEREHVGVSMALCAGDIGFFQAMHALSGIGNAAATQLVMQCCIETGFGQMEDFALGAGLVDADEQRVMRMLLTKTARYSCSMPLAAGALLGGDAELARALDALGEDLGLLFQIRDDELGLFGTTEEIGKPAGSDVREGKKTLYALYLLEAAQGEDAALVARAYGNPSADDADLAAIRELIGGLGVRDRVAAVADGYRDAAEAKIDALEIDDEHRALLTDVLAFVSRRTT